MVQDNSQNDRPNLYIPSVVGLLLVLVAAAIVWVGQLRPSAAETPAAEEPAVAAPAQTEPAPAQVSLGDASKGQTLFTSCTACHGPDAKGLPNLGKDLTTSQFVGEKSDDELVSFLKVGRSASDPLNTTGVDMPPKGGNPALSDDDLLNIVAYLRTIHQ
jgi:disulfide bond formation protein DsbB